MKLSAGFVGLDFRGAVKRDLSIIDKATIAGLTAAAEGFKLDWRQQVHRAGLGIQLGNAVGSKVFPNKGGNAAAMVYPRGQVAERIFNAFNTGAVIRAGNGKSYLAIPTRDAWVGGKGGKRLTPAQFEQHAGIDLRLAPSKRPGVFLLVGSRFRGKVRGGARDQLVYFILVPQVQLGRRLDVNALAARWHARIPELIEAASL